MNNTFFTRKFVLGMLIAFVLAFGVHGTVDAQSLTVSGDNAIRSSTAGVTFIEVSDVPIQRSFTIRVSSATTGDTITITYTSPATEGTVTIPTTREGASHIGGTITFTAPEGEDTATWTWSGTIRVNYNVTGYGLFEVTVDPSWDGAGDPDTESISAYVVRNRSQANFYTFTAPATTAPSPQTDAQRSAKTISVTTTQPWTKVQFTISSGSGNLYTTVPDYYYVSGSRLHTDLSSGSRTITAFTNGSNMAAVIYQASSATTSKVRITIPGSTQTGATHEVTCFYGQVQLERTSGNNQVQYPGFALNSPLDVKVVDSGTNRGVSGQRVTFEITDPSHNGLRPASGVTVDPDSDQSYPEDEIIILTDSSGRARVNYNPLPNTAGATTITSSVPSAPTGGTTVSQTFTNYVVEELSSTTVRGATIETTGTTTPQTYGGTQYTQGSRISIATSVANVGVDFTVTGGTLHLDPTDLDLTRPNYVSNLYVSSGSGRSASAFVRVNTNSTAKVTAHIRGSIQGDPATHVVTYFNGPITFQKVSGDEQVGNVDTNLVEPFVVQVLDGTRPVSGQVITFATSGAQAGTLEKDPNFPDNLYADNFPTTATAMTDSSGRASVLLQLSNNVGVHGVTASFDAYSETFTAVAGSAEDLAIIEIVSGNNQSADEDERLEFPLVVVVIDSSGSIVQGQNVIFKVVSSGTLVKRELSDPGLNPASPPTDPPDSDRRITVVTDANGEASVRYNVGETTGPRVVHATITTGTHNDIPRHVVFNINGTGTTTPPDQQDRGTLSVSLSHTSGNSGDPITVTATASGRSSNNQQLVTFTSNRGGTFSDNSGRTFSQVTRPTNNSGVATAQFTLPNTPGQVTITATALNYSSDSANVTVSGTGPGTGGNTLTVLTTGLIGRTTGGRVDVRVSIGVQQRDVLVSISGSGIGPFTSPTNASGIATIPVVLPNIAPATYQLYANATGYDRRLILITVSGSATTDVPVRLTIPSGTNRVQTVPIGTSATLRVRVTRTDTNAVHSGVEVTFRDSGGNDLRSVNTLTNGEATYPLPITSTGRRLITAIITDADVDKSRATPVTFEITGTRQQPTESTRLTIIQPVDSLGQTVTSGGPGAQHRLTILLNNANNTPAVNQIVTLTVRNAALTIVSTTPLITDATGRAVTQDTFRLPTAPGVYTITAISGDQTRSVTVTVFAIRLLKDTNDSDSGDNQEGERGEVLDDPFEVQVVQDTNTANTVDGVPVTWTVEDGDGELSTSNSATSGSSTLTVNSDTSGYSRVYLVLGEDDEDNRVRASVGISTVTDVFFDATGELVPDDIVIVSGNNQHITPNRYTDPMVVRVTDEEGDDLQGATVTFSLRGPSGTLTPRTATTDRNGEAEAELLPRVAGTYFVDARVTGLSSVRFTITVGDLADSIEIVSGDNQRGDPGTELDDPLVVEVLDDDDDPVSGVTVTFSITDGDGSLSDTSVTTNSRGRAQTDLTLGDDPGRNTVRASVSGVSDRVTFTATAADPAPPEPDIRLPASDRADTYWINTDTGTIHSLVGNNVDAVAPSVQDVVSLVATSNRLYWVEKTSSNSGRIRRANLNGGNIQLIRSLSTAPAGLTIDAVNSKLYVTTERGKIQSINEDGSQYEANLLVDLDTPTDIAVDAESGKIFWITEGGIVHYANLNGSGETQFASRYDTLHSIAVGGGKVFWTEETGDDAGKIHSADLDGRNIEELRETRGVPYGISYDASDNKVYWTDSHGRIMQGNRDVSNIRATVKDLVSLGDIAVPAGTTPVRPPGTFSRFDVNRDGVVDNTDAALVAEALGENPPSDPRLDVNDDGRVNFLDLLLVFDNRDNTGAAPVSVAKLPKVSREEVQKQIDLLIASNNDSLTAQHTLTYLQSLLEVVSPERTRLLANYPNPFNPETWIPYQLAASSHVQITIYNTTGNVVRTLKLGHQSEGYYTDRTRAAYWDGRNTIGEQVASGVYFYVFTANKFSASRKMLILK